MNTQYKKKVCVITCYRNPDYVRARVLRRSAKLAGAEVISLKNSKLGLLRYPEIVWKVFRARLTLHPDLYIVTFRGYEIFPLVRILTIGKPLWYDEFINPIEWAVFEHKKLPNWKLWRWIYRLLVWPVQRVLTDSRSHAVLSSQLTGIPRNKISELPVSSDEVIFVTKNENNSPKDKKFTVFYYGNMLPLHGLDTVIKAAIELRHQPEITFILIGGNEDSAKFVNNAKQKGAHIVYHKWVNFEELPGYMQRADLCLAGPFGNTLQAQYVITGKAYQYLSMARPTLIGKNYETTVFSDKKNALVVPQADPAALASAIVWAHENQDMLAQIGKAGKQLYDQKFSNDVVAKKIKALLSSMR